MENGYSKWKEVLALGERGRREIRFYLQHSDGAQQLAVVGKQKAAVGGHVSYRFHSSFHLPRAAATAATKMTLKSRRHVIRLLDSLVSSSDGPTTTSSSPTERFDSESLKDMQSHKLCRSASNFQWLGLSWLCTEKLTHYHSFQRNGVRVSVHDFVYILVEENKRLVAYLEDMYQDSKGNNMAVVRWYHKIDELGLVLPHTYSDREVFFSLTLQDLSIECIDGLASILSPQHFKTYWGVASHSKPGPFVCYRKFENGSVSPFDITRVKGYWKQDIIRSMHTRQSRDVQIVEEKTDVSEDVMPPRKRQCRERRVSIPSLADSQVAKENSPQCYQVGSRVEVLSQDSGLRGCWFRALIIKKSKDKLKVRYQDIQDASGEIHKLEEWILSSRVTSHDQFGLRISGRSVVRPSPLPRSKCRVAGAVDVGTIVDAWRLDGWWEGIVVHVEEESHDKFRVFFPGEQVDAVFSRCDLRRSQEWLGNEWTQINQRKDLVPSILSGLDMKQVSGEPCQGTSMEVTKCVSIALSKNESGLNGDVKDLSKDNLLSQLKWKSSKKRRRQYNGSNEPKVANVGIAGEPKRTVLVSRARERFMTPSSRKLDNENCKYGHDPLFSSSVGGPLTSLVMSM